MGYGRSVADVFVVIWPCYVWPGLIRDNDEADDDDDDCNDIAGDDVDCREDAKSVNNPANMVTVLHATDFGNGNKIK